MTTQIVTPISDISPIRQGDLHIWCLRLKVTTEEFALFESALSDDERRRAEVFRHQVDRDEFIAARGALRTILARYAGLAPEQLRFFYPCVCGTGRCRPAHRKPALTAACGGERIRFNLSHSAGLAAIAVCYGREVGLDVERVDVEAAAELLANDVPSARRVKLNIPVPAALQAGEFFQYWTRREAMAKALGLGLALELSPRPRHAKGRRRALDGEVRPALGAWWIRDFEPAPGYAGAVAVRDPFSKVLARFIESSTIRR